jgi:hypothetical protein
MKMSGLSYLTGEPESQSSDRLGTLLIIICSALLGIWAVKHTIALRIGLLWLGSLLSILYIYPILKANYQGISLAGWVSIILLGTIFCWIIFHYFYFSQFPTESYRQLTSIWLRSFLASILAFGCGLAIARQPSKMLWLWVGIFMSYIPLYYLYIQRAINSHSIFAPDLNFDGLLFYGKINGVLIGTLLLSAVGGILMDKLRDKNLTHGEILNYSIFFSVTAAAIIFSYACIFDSRNGTGIALILFMVSLPFVLPSLIKKFTKKYQLNVIFTSAILMTIIVIVISGVFKFQDKFNIGWRGFFEDVEIAVQIDKYPNWINFELLNYPVRASGEGVRGNTYVRFAWATAGLRLIYENPLGTGTNHESLRKILNKKYGVPTQGENPPATHSGLIDLTLAYGVPFSLLLLSTIFFNMFFAVKVDGVHKCFILAILIAILPLYLFGELSTGHAVEMLFFLLGFISAINFASSMQTRSMVSGY